MARLAGRAFVGFVAGFATATFVACMFGFSSPVKRDGGLAQLDATPAIASEDMDEVSLVASTAEPAWSRYLSADFTSARGGSRIECFLRGKSVSFDLPADCHGKPPFWRWWHDYRNCYASNVCLRRGELQVFRGSGRRADLDGLASHGSLACVNWITPEAYKVVVRDGKPPARSAAAWHEEPSLHSSRVLPGHFGHDVLNSLFYGFETLAQANLTTWLVGGRRPTQFAFERDAISSKVVDLFFDYVQYGSRAPAWQEYHCFKLAMLSSSHALDANLVFRASSPTAAKKRLWRRYRDILLERVACGDRRPCALLAAVRRPRRRPTCGLSRISVLSRSTEPGSSSVLTANGRGRRIVNARELVEALGTLGTVVEADPGKMSLADQQRLMLETDVLVGRMGSSVVNAMFMPPGGLCVEIEAPDPAHLYYDHPSTFEELAELFDHAFARSSDANETLVDSDTHVLVGDVQDCCDECRGPPGLAALADAATVKTCCRRCARLYDRSRASSDASRGDAYLRRKWYMNWWLSNCRANVAEILDLVGRHLGCEAVVEARDEPPRLAAVPTLSDCSYEPSPWERDWASSIEARESDDVDWTAGCDAMRRAERDSRRWLDWISSPRGPAPRDVFSGWTCPPGHAPPTVVEPLVGHLRHPLFHCVGPRKDTFDLMFSKDYLVLATAADVRRGSRAFFFDAGASVAYDNCWWGCTKWFVDAYAARGINFDRILLWEAADVDHAAYWRSVPPSLKPRMQYFNTPLTLDEADDLWSTLVALAQPSDFVAVKLDVDDHNLEAGLVRRLLDSPAALARVDELFWEHHVNGSPLRRTRVDFFDAKGIGWGDQIPPKTAQDGHLRDSYRLFAALRRRGVRAHAWI